MKKFSKILSAMLALLLLFSMTLLFSSCGSEEEEVTPGADGTISTEEGLPPLDVKNLGGKEMLMLWPEMHADGHYLHNELAVAESSGDVIDQAVMQRNTVVQSAYNVKITTQTMFISDVAKTVRNEYNGGTSTYSALACSINNSNLIALQQEGGLADFNSLEYYDESQPWWNHDLMQDLSIANARYFASGDIIYSDDFYPYATFVNDKLSANSGITENYHELVKNKEWTLEKFHTLAAQAQDNQVDGDPNTWSTQDINGAVINENFAKAAYYSAGKGMVAFDSKGYPVWQMDVAWTQPILEKLIGIIHNDKACFNAGQFDDHAIQELNLFTGGKALFLVEELIFAERITKADAAVGFTLLPYPLYDEESEYTTVLNDSLVVCIPVVCADKEDIGLVLSAMSRESVNTLTPAFFETVLTYRYMQNPESVETLEVILDSTVAPDIATIKKWGKFMEQFKILAFANSTDFASYHRQNIGKAMGELEAYSVLLDNFYANK